MDQAKQDLVRSHRRQVLVTESEAWARAEQMRRYVADMARVVSLMSEGEEKDAAQAWLAWSRDAAEREDPLALPLEMPTPPEPTAKNLEPFLGAWSFHGPEGRGY